MFDNLRSRYRATLKSSDTEEHIDLAFYRPIGFAWACLAERLGITPNAITIASIFLGVGAGICFWYSSLGINIIGIGLLIWANSFDSADGQLARMTKQYSRIGRILDGAAGDMWFISIYVAICLRTVRTVPFFSEHPWVIWVIASLAGIFHAKQAATADYYRQMHLLFLKGAGGSELDSSSDILARYNELSWSKNFFSKLVAKVYYLYTRSQEKSTKSMQQLNAAIKSAPQGMNARAREEFLNLSRPLCKWENFMTFNWRSIFLFISILIGQPWIYFIIELTIFNIVLVYTIRKHEQACRKVIKML